MPRYVTQCDPDGAWSARDSETCVVARRDVRQVGLVNGCADPARMLTDAARRSLVPGKHSGKAALDETEGSIGSSSFPLFKNQVARRQFALSGRVGGLQAEAPALASRQMARI